ncbi:MAG: hypothetical protein ATN35_10775 [Epulopiscium sp. Nele67-Bin004]|nr:MAG: hypothetical protein ATN35_10775 [Epulopiscium sp. Nele67-Bin004]
MKELFVTEIYEQASSLIKSDVFPKSIVNMLEHNNVEQTEHKGGSYGELRKEVEGQGDKYEVHHMPANSASDLDTNDGPAIVMDKEDHRQTASCGNSKEAQEYREKQKELIEEGKFKEAFQMDVDDIREKFGDKYDSAIKEAEQYVDTLDK